MAEVIRTHTFKKHKPEKHDYDKLFDGRIWKLKRDEDYENKATAARATLYIAAKRRGLKIKTSIVEDGNAIVVQSVGKVRGKK
jgi:hypothetical protein